MSSLPGRIWDNVEKTDDCWLWTAGRTDRGYGKAYLNGRQVYAHRVIYEDQVGPIPASAQLDHQCHVRHCVNPVHLRPATNLENSRNRRGAASGSKSGVRGVHRFQGKWRVQVRAGGRTHSGGLYDDLDEAAEVAAALRERLFEVYAEQPMHKYGQGMPSED